MKTGVFLNYIGLGANLLHLAYCHKIASLYGPITLISLAKNLDQVLEDDQLIKEVITFNKNKNIIDIPKISSNLSRYKSFETLDLPSHCLPFSFAKISFLSTFFYIFQMFNPCPCIDLTRPLHNKV